MIEGLEDIRSAAESLATRDERLKKRLREAGKEFWSATYFQDEWPATLRERAEQVQKLILARGTVKDTVSQMSLEEARHAAEKILHLLIDFEQAASNGAAADRETVDDSA